MAYARASPVKQAHRGISFETTMKWRKWSQMLSIINNFDGRTVVDIARRVTKSQKTVKSGDWGLAEVSTRSESQVDSFSRFSTMYIYGS